MCKSFIFVLGKCRIMDSRFTVNKRTIFSSIPMLLLILGMFINRSNYGTSAFDAQIWVLASGAFLFLYLLTSPIKVDWWQLLRILGLAAMFCISTGFSSVVSATANLYSLIICLLLYLIFSLSKCTATSIKFILNSLVYIIIVVTILVFFWGQEFGDGVRKTLIINGLYKDPNYLSLLFGCAFVYLLYEILFVQIKLFSVFKLAIIFFGIVILGSRASFLSIILPGALLIYMRFFRGELTLQKLIGRVVLIFLVIISLVSSISFSGLERFIDLKSYSDNIRLTIWHYAFEAFRNSPLIGSGVGSTGYFAQFVPLHHYSSSHNCFLDLIGYTGILGVGIFVLEVKNLLKVKNGNLLFTVSFMQALFIPLFFVNGLEGLTFWGPMILLQSCNDVLKEYSVNELYSISY